MARAPSPFDTNFATGDFSAFAGYADRTGINGDLFNKPEVLQALSDTNVAAAFEKPNFLSTTNIPDFGGDLLNNTAAGANASSFTFITAPAQVSYSQGAEVQQVSIFGSNNPPLTVSGRNAGELQLGDALMEGFTLGKQVGLPINQLFVMQQVVLDSQRGFVNVPVYSVFAGREVGAGRKYGDFVITDIQVDEELRDLSGQTTRARVSVSFKEVPAYQIDTGIDQAGSSTGGQNIKPEQQVNQAAQQATTVAQTKPNTPAQRPPAPAPRPSTPAPRPPAPTPAADRGPTLQNRNYTVGGITYDWRTGRPVR